MKAKLPLSILFSAMSILNVAGQTTITLQPGSEGKDAEIGFIVPNNNYANSEKLSPYAWTQSGDLNITRPLLEFDLSGIPADAIITDAKLSLYYNPHFPVNPDEHAGNNAFWIRRITSPWVENTVTWNTQPSTTTENQVSIPQSTSSTQNYPNINVTSLIQDMIADPDDGFGFMLQLQNETPYTVVMLASSDNQDEALHPKLVITYTLSSDDCITLQPGSEGKDAEIGFIVPNNNYANSEKLSPYAWTQSGDLNITRPLLEFDLSGIPVGATVTLAALSLYYNPYFPVNPDEHAGNNAFWIRRITSPWDENTVTWNTQPSTTTENQVSIPQSTSSTQNYTDINVTPMIQDMIADPDDGFGFMLQLQNETPYTVVMLASSDNQDSTIHPNLRVCYINNVGMNEITTSPVVLSMYPNPFSHSVTIRLSSKIKDGELTIFDMHGQKVKTITALSGQEIEVRRDTLESGMYFFNLTENNELIVADKFIIID